jgi:hypothetical protein
MFLFLHLTLCVVQCVNLWHQNWMCLFLLRFVRG